METSTEQEVLLVRLKGELDLAAADRVRGELDQRMVLNNTRHLLLDLSRVTFIDSSGIGVILGRYRKLAGSGGRLGILRPQPQVKRILDIAGVSSLVPFYRSEKEGLSKLQGKG
ncbi:MAG: anti-sigma factor antagonist [Syntrophomonadaceae bacterium]|nr:anti-sigma factor antagonist [Syntrophomonadaceae bacterium]